PQQAVVGLVWIFEYKAHHYSQWYQPTEQRPMHTEMSDLVDRTLLELRKKAWQFPKELMGKADSLY
ncbi:hypothetical protein, partial [Pseudoflavonifractor phocaeensis]|uniref:hypothetical protein n=1 Tax=Pseudoflavonifractor phocaeensis TaxID=1870988 RepID=UPI001957F642